MTSRMLIAWLFVALHSTSHAQQMQKNLADTMPEQLSERQLLELVENKTITTHDPKPIGDSLLSRMVCTLRDGSTVIYYADQRAKLWRQPTYFFNSLMSYGLYVYQKFQQYPSEKTEKDLVTWLEDTKKTLETLNTSIDDKNEVNVINTYQKQFQNSYIEYFKTINEYHKKRTNQYTAQEQKERAATEQSLATTAPRAIAAKQLRNTLIDAFGYGWRFTAYDPITNKDVPPELVFKDAQQGIAHADLTIDLSGTATFYTTKPFRYVINYLKNGWEKDTRTKPAQLTDKLIEEYKKRKTAYVEKQFGPRNAPGLEALKIRFFDSTQPVTYYRVIGAQEQSWRLNKQEALDAQREHIATVALAQQAEGPVIDEAELKADIKKLTDAQELVNTLSKQWFPSSVDKKKLALAQQYIATEGPRIEQQKQLLARQKERKAEQEKRQSPHTDAEWRMREKMLRAVLAAENKVDKAVCAVRNKESLQLAHKAFAEYQDVIKRITQEPMRPTFTDKSAEFRRRIHTVEQEILDKETAQLETQGLIASIKQLERDIIDLINKIKITDPGSDRISLENQFTEKMSTYKTFLEYAKILKLKITTTAPDELSQDYEGVK
jgi:hypothetical protein